MPLISDVFPCGHERAEANTTYSTAKGRTYARCLTCNNERSRLRKEKKRRAAGVPTVEQMRMAKKNKALATDHLKLPLRAVKAESELHLAMEENRAKCEGREADWVDYDEENIPNRSVARAMCEGCSLLRECSIFADKSSPAWGIWGGKVYVDGKAV